MERLCVLEIKNNPRLLAYLAELNDIIPESNGKIEGGV